MGITNCLCHWRMKPLDYLTTRQLHKLFRVFEKKVWKEGSILQKIQQFYGRTDGEEICKKTDNKGPDHKTWYVLHQGVLNHNKGKMRDAFDFRNLNKRKLVTWVWFDKSTSRSVNKVRTGSIYGRHASHVLKVQEKQRSFLRFLWWNEGNLILK